MEEENHLQKCRLVGDMLSSSLEDNFQHENHSSTAVDSISPKIPSGYPDDLAKGLEYLSDFLLDKKLISSST